MQSVKPSWSAEARLPVKVRLPIPVSNALYGNGSGMREIVIADANQELPSLIIRWMTSDARYRTWFLDATQMQPAPTAETPPEATMTGDVAAPDADAPTPGVSVDEAPEGPDEATPTKKRRVKRLELEN